MAQEIIKPRYPASTAIGGVWPYLASVGISEAMLQNCCIKKGTVKKLNSRQAVTVEIDAVEYENVPVWIHTDCGARLAAIKGVEAASPENYFKDAALMFPFPADTIIRSQDNSASTTIEPIVFVIVYTNPENSAKTALGVIQIIQNLNREFPANTAPFRTYRPYIQYRIKYWYYENMVEHVEYSRHYLWDVLGDKIASIPTMTPEGFALPFFPAENMTDEEKNYHLTPFLSGAFKLNDYSLNVVSSSRLGTYGTIGPLYYVDSGYIGFDTNIFAGDSFSMLAASSFCDQEYSPGWEGDLVYVDGGTYTGDINCKCNYGTIEFDYSVNTDRYLHASLSHVVAADQNNIWQYQLSTLSKFYGETVEIEQDYHLPDAPYRDYYSGQSIYTRNLELVFGLPGEDPLHIDVGIISSETYIGNPVRPSTPMGYFSSKEKTGLLFYEISYSFSDNFFIVGETYNLIKVAEYSRTMTAEGYAGPIDWNNSVIVATNVRYGYDVYDSIGIIGETGSVQYIINAFVAYHETFISDGFYSDKEDAALAANGIGWEYYYMSIPGQPNIEVEIVGLHFVPFNIDIALLES